MRINGIIALTAAVFALSAAANLNVVLSAQGARTVWDGVYTEAQAQRGTKVYADQCSTCHGAEMKGGPGIPGLVGPEFQFSWNKKPVGGIFDYAKMFMPPGQSGSLTDQQYVDIVAAILQNNRFPPSPTAELPTTKSDLDAITFIDTKP